MSKNKRIKYIDIARGFAILFIVLSHALGESSNSKLLFNFLFSFHVILFFILSGYTFSLKEESSLKFIKNKFVRIMIPYFTWALLFLIPYMLFGSNIGKLIGTHSSFDLKTQIINVFYGNGNHNALKQNTSLWFLPALFSTEILYYFLIKLLHKKSKTIKIITLIPLTIISYLANYKLNIIFPWGINTALVIGIFYYIGYLFKEYDIFTKEKLFKGIYIIPILILGSIFSYINGKISYLGYQYNNLTYALIAGLSLSIGTIYIASLMKENKILEYIGKNTMGILIFHKIIILVFRTMLGPITTLLKNSNAFIELGIALVIVILTTICSLIATEIVRKIFPLLIGEKRTNRKTYEIE